MSKIKKKTAALKKKNSYSYRNKFSPTFYDLLKLKNIKNNPAVVEEVDTIEDFPLFSTPQKESNFNENILAHDNRDSKKNLTARLGKNKLIKLIFSSLVKNEKKNLLAALKSSFILNNSLVLSNSLKEKLLLNVK